MFQPLRRHFGNSVVAIYLIALALVVSIGLLALIRIGHIRTTVDDLIRNLAVDKALSDEIIKQVSLIRFYAHQYVQTQNQADVDRFHEEFAKLDTLLTQANHQITNPKRLTLIGQIESSVQDYGDAFNQVAAIIRKRQRIQAEVLEVQEFIALHNLSALRIHALSANDPRLFLAFTNAQKAFQVMILNAVKYLEEGDEGYAVQFEVAYQQAQTALEAIETTVQDPSQSQNTTNAKAAADTYNASFQTLRADYQEMLALFTNHLNPLEPEITRLASEIATTVDQEFQTQSDISRRLITQTRLVLVVITTLVTLTGLGLSVVANRRIVESEEAAEKIHTEQEKSATILRSVGDAIAVTDLQMRTQYGNPALTELTGYPPDEVVGQPISSLLGMEVPKPMSREMWRALDQGEIWQGEVSGHAVSGQRYDVALTVAALRDPDGALTGYVFSSRNISQRKALERARSQFLNSVSHQLRTPVTTLKLYVHAMQHAELPDKLADYPEIMRQEIDWLTQLIQDMLEMTALDSGKAVTTWETISPYALVADAVTRHQTQAEDAGITLILPPDVQDPPTVKGDRARLLQALNEVVENAIVFTPSGGRVTFEVAPVEDAGQSWVTIAVQDTGPGIPPEEQDHIFDRFFRGNLADSGHTPGVGLGLSITQEILRAHGGQVTVESDGNGSRFTLWLPSE